jgi:GNAT superfamily N-acetyltransferase
MRSYEDADEAQVLGLLATALGKVADDRYRSFFRWKHLENPFGRSFMWVATVDSEVAGFRSFLRWRFVDPAGDPLEAVRAVDTATSPDFRGMGIFRDLTMHGLDELRPRGIQFVFNTPNDQSRPGYLKMGWHIDRRVPVQVRPRSLLSLSRMVRARTAAEPWSLPTDLGEPVDSVAHLAASRVEGAEPTLVTDRSPDFVRWRYAGCPAVGSRAVRAGNGAMLVRLRQRGASVECTIGDVLGTPTPREARRAIRHALRAGSADYAIATTAMPIAGMVPVARLGPVQTRRAVVAVASTLPLRLSLGEVELF